MLTEYLTELRTVALLSADEEVDHWRRYRQGANADSRARLIEAYQPLVFKVVMQVRPPDPHVMDMIQEGTIGLIEAVERFDHTLGVRFSTFATYRIRGRVLNALRRAAPRTWSLEGDGTGDLPPASRLADAGAEAALQEVEDAVTAGQIRRAMDALPERERAILRATYVEARAPRSVAEELRISLSHFYRLQKQALALIRRVAMDDLHLPGRLPGY